MCDGCTVDIHDQADLEPKIRCCLLAAKSWDGVITYGILHGTPGFYLKLMQLRACGVIPLQAAPFSELWPEV